MPSFECSESRCLLSTCVHSYDGPHHDARSVANTLLHHLNIQLDPFPKQYQAPGCWRCSGRLPSIVYETFSTIPPDVRGGFCSKTKEGLRGFKMKPWGCNKAILQDTDNATHGRRMHKMQVYHLRNVERWRRAGLRRNLPIWQLSSKDIISL